MEMELHGGDRKSKLHDATLKLSDFDMEKTQSHRLQLIAKLPEGEKQVMGRWGTGALGQKQNPKVLVFCPISPMLQRSNAQVLITVPI